MSVPNYRFLAGLEVARLIRLAKLVRLVRVRLNNIVHKNVKA